MLGADCSTYTADIFNPVCWFQDPLGIQPSLGINQATCTSGTAEQQAACQAGVTAAQNEANANSAYACATGSYQLLCSLGITDSNGSPSSNFWVLIAVGGVVGFLLLKDR